MTADLKIKPNLNSTLGDWLSYIEQNHPRTIELGLARVKTVAKSLSLLKALPYIITVAGTNGKGTTCRAIEMMLLEAGYRVGVYSSPHLIDYKERVRINNQHLDDATHVSSFNEIENSRGDISLTYFEYSTLSALWLFKKHKLDVAILEVGLGGRLDATNIVDADLAVITSIDIDHTDYLGFDRESIGHEKAGIFKSNSIAIVGEPDMPLSIGKAALNNNISLYKVSQTLDDGFSYQKKNDTWQFLSPKITFQRLPVPNIPIANAATAVAALIYSPLKVSETAIIEGLKKASLPGRTQIIKTSPMVMLDVAHNPHAANYLNSYIKNLTSANKEIKAIRIVIGMLKDKDIKKTIDLLDADHWYCASLYGERGALADELIILLKNKKLTSMMAFDSVTDAYKKALQNADKHDLIVVCGSFLTVSQVLGLN